MNNKEYIIDILKSILLWTFIPNVFLFIFWKFDSSFGFVSTLTLIFNSLILPIVLIYTVKNINEKYNKNWWYLNYIFFAFCVLSSIYLNLFNWILSVEKDGGFYGRHNIDSGTWMIINLEKMVSLGILSVGLIYDIVKSISKASYK